MKKILILVAIVLFAVGCSKNDEANETAQTPETNDVVSTVEPESPDAPSFVSESITIGEGTPYALNGMLTVPVYATADSPVPAVVLVQGSGPSDMDLTMGPNKPFLEIAEYLSANGIAVIRYDKRTYAHGLAMVTELGGAITVYEETIADAVLAANLLKTDPRIDANQVYIAGISLGGMLAPRIHDAGGDFAGLILLAGSPRFLMDLSKDQNIFVIEATTEAEALDAAIAEFEEAWDMQIAALLDLPLDIAKTVDLGGMSAYYLIDLYENPAQMYIERTNVPFLILQGTDDVQVLADVDFEMYKEIFADRDNDVTFILYDGLNHLFMPSTGRNILEIIDEYMIPSAVDGKVLRDMVEWIKGR